jgi:hypothetical protein
MLLLLLLQVLCSSSIRSVPCLFFLLSFHSNPSILRSFVPSSPPPPRPTRARDEAYGGVLSAGVEPREESWL